MKYERKKIKCYYIIVKHMILIAQMMILDYTHEKIITCVKENFDMNKKGKNKMEKINILPALKILELERELRITSKDLYNLKQKYTKLEAKNNLLHDLNNDLSSDIIILSDENKELKNENKQLVNLCGGKHNIRNF